MDSSTRQEGMVLLMTIIMVVIMTLLVLSLMQDVLLYFKVSHQVVNKHRDLYQLEAIANRISKAVFEPDCVFTDTNPNQIVAMLSHHDGCVFADHGRQYDYLIDDLGIYPCLHLRSNKKLYSSHHWLISVATQSAPQSLLQLRVAQPYRLLDCELLETREINNGGLSWRYVEDHV